MYFSHHDVAILCAQSVPLGSAATAAQQNNKTTINRPLLSARLRSNFNKLQAAVADAVAVAVAVALCCLLLLAVVAVVAVIAGKLVVESARVLASL